MHTTIHKNKIKNKQKKMTKKWKSHKPFKIEKEGGKKRNSDNPP